MDAIRGFEGFSARPYWDYKQWTSGYGTRAGGPDETIDRATADARLQEELSKAAGYVDAIRPDIPAGARNALVSLTYNAGPGWIQSGLGDLVRFGDWNAAAQKILEYNKAGGAVNEGLSRRRATEASWFAGGVQPSADAPMGANAIARAQGAPAAFPRAPSGIPQIPAFAGLPASAPPAGGGGGGDDFLPGGAALQPPALLPPFNPRARMAAMRPFFARRG